MRRLSIALVAVVMAALVPISTRAGPETAEQAVEHYQNAPLSVMKNAQKPGFKGRFETLKPVVTESFDLAFMARVTNGRYWDPVSEHEQEHFVKAFSNFSVATFANRFDGYSGERFETVKVRGTSPKDILVFTQIVKPRGDKTGVNYLLRAKEDRPRIIDVFLGGSISEVAMRRSEFTSVIRRAGIDDLITAIQRKTRELASQ